MEFYFTRLVKFSHSWGTWGQRYRVPEAQKIDPKVTILCLVFKFLIFWCCLDTHIIKKVSCELMIYIFCPSFIHVGPIGPKI